MWASIAWLLSRAEATFRAARPRTVRREVGGVRVVGRAEFADRVAEALRGYAELELSSPALPRPLRSVRQMPYRLCRLKLRADVGRPHLWLDAGSAAAPPVALASFFAFEAELALTMYRPVEVRPWAGLRRRANVHCVRYAVALEYQRHCAEIWDGSPELLAYLARWKDLFLDLRISRSAARALDRLS